MRGRGSVYRRGTKWWIKYYVNGCPYRESTGTEDRDLAHQILVQRLSEAAQGRVVRPEHRRLTVRQLLELVWQDYHLNGRRSAERLRYSAARLIQFFGPAKAAWVTTADCQRYVQWRLREGASNATVNRELSALRRGYALAHRSGLVLAVPAMPMLRERNVRAGFFDESEFLAILAFLPAALHSVFLVAYLTGWRVISELLTRQWKHVDFKAGWLRLEPGETKNERGRMFPLFPDLASVLRRQREYTEQVQRERGEIIPWVFHRRGKPIKSFRRAWRQACQQAGLAGKIPHDFRRTAVRNLIRRGVPERVAMELVGHRTRSVFDRYAIVSEVNLKEAGGRLKGLLPGTLLGTLGADISGQLCTTS